MGRVWAASGWDKCRPATVECQSRDWMSRARNDFRNMTREGLESPTYGLKDLYGVDSGMIALVADRCNSVAHERPVDDARWHLLALGGASTLSLSLTMWVSRGGERRR